MTAWWRRFRARVRYRRFDADLKRELDVHRAMKEDELGSSGSNAEEMHRELGRALGNTTRAREDARAVWISPMLEGVWLDCRLALRTLRKNPAFTAVAVVTLALGIGANTAIFSVVNAVLLRPLPYRDPGSLVLVEPRDVGLTPGWMLPAWRERARRVQALAGFNGPRPLTLIVRGVPNVVQATDVTWDFLPFLGVPPAFGRDFAANDGTPGAAGVVIVSHELWQRHFDGDRTVIGSTVTINRTPVTVVGVLPPAFRFPTAGTLPTFGLPADTQPDVLRVWNGRDSLNVIARLTTGTPLPAVRQELLAIFRQASAHEFSTDLLDRMQISVLPLQERLVGDLSRRLWLVMGAVTFVLLVGTVNLAMLVLARASGRQRELAVRSALGARKGRLAQLILTENLIVALLGAAGALLFASLTRGVARVLLADRIPHVAEIPLDWTVVGFTIVVATGVGMLCGLMALPGACVKFTGVFSAAATPSVSGRNFIRRLLLSVETAVTFVLVVGATLLVQTVWNLSRQDTGFDADRLLTVRVNPGIPPEMDRRARFGPDNQFGAVSRYWANFFTDLRSRLEQLPGVTAAGAISLGPLEGVTTGLSNAVVDGRSLFPNDNDSTIAVAFVTPRYLPTMRIPIVAGRDFEAADQLGAPLVAIVNEAFRHRAGSNASLIGARITSESGPEAFTIVGVTRDVPDRSLRVSPDPTLLLPIAQMPGVHISWGSLTFVLRTADPDPLQVAADVRRAIWGINPNIIISGVTTMNARLAVGMRTERDTALLFGLFALGALVMAAVGVYGVAAYAIAQRTKEVGIRLALGATAGDVRRLMVAHTLWPTAIGIVAGVAIASILTRLLTSTVYGVTPLDVPTFAAGAVILLGVALGSTWMPARRATRIDPLVALRTE